MRPVYFDVTHLRHNAAKTVKSGIRRVDLIYAEHFLAHRPDSAAIQYGLAGPSLVEPLAPLQQAIAASRARLAQPGGASAAYRAVLAWLGGAPDRRPPPVAGAWRHGPLNDARSYLRFLSPPSRLDETRLARGAIYLNVAQHAFGYGVFFRWLRQRRPDLCATFFVHDLLPLDHPEFWPDGYRRRFALGFEMLAATAGAFITSTVAVKLRLEEELQRFARADVPILALPLPPMIEAEPRLDPALRQIPYFVMLGTIEPRKNHLLVLNVWRRLIARGGVVPRLVIVGQRGWGAQHELAILERSEGLDAVVIEAGDLPDTDLQTLIAGARGLLFPSYAEGFGLPLVEALAVGTPAIAADIPVLRETTDGKALFADPLDGPAWIDAIDALADPASARGLEARRLARAFEPMRRPRYFAAVEAFLAEL